MSKVKQIEVVCPDCGTKSEIMIYDSINVSLDPRMKEQVQSPEFMIHTCPQCGSKNRVVYPTLYHDMEHKFQVALSPTKDGIEAWVKSFGEAKKIAVQMGIPEDKVDDGYRNVVVMGGPEQLAEKVRILEDGYDHVIMEMLKLSIIAELLSKGDTFDVDLQYLQRNHCLPVTYNKTIGEDGNALLSFAYLNMKEKKLGFLTVPRETYEMLESDKAGIYEKLAAEEGKVFPYYYNPQPMLFAQTMNDVVADMMQQ